MRIVYPDYASNRIKVYEGDAKNIEDLESALNNVDVVLQVYRDHLINKLKLS